MADNTRLPIGTADGDTYASDDITGVKFQRVKLVLGADGVNGGDVASGNPVPVSGTFWQATQPVSGTFWQATQPVSIASPVVIKQSNATATTSQVADTATSTTLLASNANRVGATIMNDSSAVLYVKFGTTASATDYTVRMVQYAYFEVPFGYTGGIDGIWATDPNDGAARITELT